MILWWYFDEQKDSIYDSMYFLIFLMFTRQMPSYWAKVNILAFL